MKRLIAVFVVLSLLVVSASAAGVYEIEDDAVVLSQPVSMYSLNSGASTFATGSDYSQDIYNLLVAEFDTNSLFMQFLRNVDQHTYSSMLSSSTISTNISVLLSFLSVSPNVQFLQDNNLPGITNQNVTFTEIVRQGLLGLRNMNMVPSGSVMLAEWGSNFTLTGDWTLASVMNHGFTGLRSLIAGSETDNSYSVTITDGDELSSTIQAVGIGPMIQLYLEYIQKGVASLSYVIGDEDDMEAKQASKSVLKEFTKDFLKGDSDASVKVKDIGVLKNSSKSVQQLGQTGVDPSQAFDQLTGNESIFSFFTEETANDLDTTVSTYSRDSGSQIVTSYYEDSRMEFYDLIGKGGEE